MSCGHSHGSLSVHQTLDELDFERGIWSAALNNDEARLTTLLQKGAYVDKNDNSGYTALHYASRAGHLNICQHLIRAGACVNAQTRAGKATPLHRAATAGHGEIVRILLENGGDPEMTDADGKTCMQRALDCGNLDIYNDIAKKLQ